MVRRREEWTNQQEVSEQRGSCGAELTSSTDRSGPLGQWIHSDDEVNLTTVFPPTKLINETTLLPERDLSTFLIFFQEVNKLIITNYANKVPYLALLSSRRKGLHTKQYLLNTTVNH